MTQAAGQFGQAMGNRLAGGLSASPFARAMEALSPVPLPSGTTPAGLPSAGSPAPANTLPATVSALPSAAPDQTAPAHQGIGTASPSARAASAYSYYISKGLSPQAAAGVVGNMQQESAFRDDVLSGKRRGDGGRSGFAAQWNGKRANNLMAFAKSRGESSPSLKTQLDFALEEGNPSSPYADAGAVKAFQLMKTAPTPAAASTIFRRYFERPSANDAAKRAKYADAIFGAKGDPTAVAESFGAPGLGTTGAGSGTEVAASPENTLMSRLFGLDDQQSANGQQPASAGGGGGGMQMAQAEAPQVAPVVDEAPDFLAAAQQRREERTASLQQKSAIRKAKTKAALKRI